MEETVKFDDKVVLPFPSKVSELTVAIFVVVINEPVS